MSREELQRASDELRAASELVEGEHRETLYDQSNQIADLATRDRGPDHGRLDRHMHTLGELVEDLGGDAGEHVEAALDHLREYRSGVEGV